MPTAGERRESLLGDIDPEMISLLSHEEQLEFVKSMQVLVGGEGLRDFVYRVAPHEPPPRHLDPIIEIIEYSRIKPVRVCIDIPPGHAKTTMLMRALAWWLSPDQSPGDLCAYLTYSDSQARSKSRITKETLQLLGQELIAPKATSDGFWRTTQGGGLVAAGARAGIMGKRIPGIAVYDDPYKDMQEARSIAINSMVIERFKGAVFSRLQGGSVIVVHTRWAMDDLIGYIDKNLKWDHISIPAICEKVDPNTGVDSLGREVGEALWPDKYPIEICRAEDGEVKMCGHDGHLNEYLETMGPHVFHAMYQGSPRPAGTAVFHEPARYTRGSNFDWSGKRGVITVDPAATASTSADYSVILVMAVQGLGFETKVWIVDCLRIQEEIPVLVKRIARVQKQYRLMVACEAVSGFKAVPQSLRALDPTLRVIDITTGGRDKLTRALPLSGAWNSGRVLVPSDTGWADVYVEEMVRFTGSGRQSDDQVDASAHAFNVLYRERLKVTSSDYVESSI